MGGGLTEESNQNKILFYLCTIAVNPNIYSLPFPV